MDAMRVVILAIAIVAAGAAALLVRGMVSDRPSAPVQAQVTETVRVLVAGRDLNRGDRLGADVLQWRRWPENAISDRYITDRNSEDAREELESAVVRSLIVEGEPILDAKIVRGAGSGLMAAILTPGMRAIAIDINAETTAGGFILPGDHVDVILTRQLRGAQGQTKAKSETVLRDVKVLAVDQNYQGEDDQDVVLGDTITLELSAKGTERLLKAQASGSITLVLRPLTAGEAVEEDLEDYARSGIRVTRYGQMRN
ncbi:MAG: Flp pilus assembly protein CpaB [Pseudomonadota bacterium]